MSFRESIQKILFELGWDVRSVKYGHSHLSAALRLKQLDIAPKTIIDVGASNGMWTRMMMDYFPKADYSLVEALSLHEKELEKLMLQHDNVDYTIAAAGDKEDEINIVQNGTFGSWASATQEGIKVKQISLDKLAETKNLTPHFGIKIDVHNREMAILEGAKEVLSQTYFLIMEAYNFPNMESLTFYELADYLNKQGFICFDIVEVLREPQKQMLSQMDLIFIHRKNYEAAGLNLNNLLLVE